MLTNKDLHGAEDGRRCSDVHPRFQTDLPFKKKGISMDKAISKTKFGFFNYVVIFVSGLILNAVLMETCGISFIIPVSECDLKLSASQKGILSAISYFGIICSSHLWGYLADTKGRRSVIQPTLFIAFLLSIVSSLVQNFYLLATLRFLNGFFISGSSATIYAYLGEFHSNKHRGRALMGSALLYGIACLFLPSIAWLVTNQEWQFDIPLIGITYKPWRLLLVICGLPGFLSSVILLFLPESPKFLLNQGDSKAAYQILQQINRWNNGKKSQLESFEIYEEDESIENRRRMSEAKVSRFPLLKSIWSQTVPLFKPPHLGPTLLICTIQFGIYATSNGFYMFFADILNKMAANLDSFIDPMAMCDVINMKSTNISDNQIVEKVCNTKLELALLEQGILLEFLYASAFAVISLIINKVGKFKILLLILEVSGLCGIACMLTDIPLVQIYSFIGLMCSGIGVNIVNSATVEIYPTNLRAMAICISLMFGRLGSVVGANIAALLLDDHCETVFYLSGTTVMAVGIFCFFVPGIHEKVKSRMSVIQNDPRLSVASFR
ncbi:synaptic vesicle glycoprotein 2B-like [Contarinia nasturtii]|uniref:synaptic vesicle glycoprotein 2B-like n=1 Tax=Contarinia nasturtii TaxID=265458 RepID=UPI0012D49CB2|nr:synaptic vesicle glycoprotein 2B-like [Contarinia nasturtii]XP_031629387.1 synaptic vesicle glycoprotein 2B-like [Contarinia nasturtii]